MNMPSINMRRTFLIARRDYLGYVKTWGFWISFFLPFIFGLLGAFVGASGIDVSPARYETILDATGKHRAAIEASYVKQIETKDKNALEFIAKTDLLTEAERVELKALMAGEDDEALNEWLQKNQPTLAENMINQKRDLIYVDPPADTIEGLKPYLRGEQMITYDGKEARLNGALLIKAEDDVEYWSTTINNPRGQRLAINYFEDQAEAGYLASGGLTIKGLDAARKDRVRVYPFDPAKSDTESQEVTDTDRLPYLIASILAMILWFTVFSGSYMLLTSMLEEKLNKLLEMMLASTNFAEIIFGKLLGVAALTLTAMLPYILIGLAFLVGAIFMADPETVAGITKAFSVKMIVFFFIFLFLGYVFYGALFIAMGALSQSMQDAQTLTTPIMLILTGAGVGTFIVGMDNPESPIITAASWFPLSAPFAAIVRLPSDPPLWELAGSALFLAICCIGVVWVGGRVFRYGVLSGAGMSAVTDWLKRVILRRKDV